MASRFEGIMELMGSAGDEIGGADEVKDRTILVSKELNAQMLSERCRRQEWRVSESRQLDLRLRRAGRKNCGGMPPSA